MQGPPTSGDSPLQKEEVAEKQHPRARRGAPMRRVWQKLGRRRPPMPMLRALLIPPHRPPVESAEVPLKE
ncbi:hypothetical protein NDU88_004516 [Pleurodeles waltl]|uniref:Uncharacterized protein n=1 Tax=Pleurodeles waltl TaxID=8319 RepID=A0AAV7M9G5_PLEWA|nr:hypothetical protein NDU88_004516 [Pleurodeles waltl]